MCDMPNRHCLYRMSEMRAEYILCGVFVTNGNFLILVFKLKNTFIRTFYSSVRYVLNNRYYYFLVYCFNGGYEIQIQIYRYDIIINNIVYQFKNKDC